MDGDHALLNLRDSDWKVHATAHQVDLDLVIIVIMLWG